MRTALHIFTRPEDELTRELIAQQRAMTDMKVEIVNLAGENPDYDKLVDAIFSADSVAVW